MIFFDLQDAFLSVPSSQNGKLRNILGDDDTFRNNDINHFPLSPKSLYEESGRLATSSVMDLSLKDILPLLSIYLQSVHNFSCMYYMDDLLIIDPQ